MPSGKGGKIIEQMRREIGAQIRVLPKEQIPAWVSNTDEMVQVSLRFRILFLVLD